jgi:hypothetical protein
MNKIVLSILLIFFLASVKAQKYSPEVEAKFKLLNWLSGTWERTNVKAGRTASERWHIDEPYSFIGLGVTMNGTDTVFLEKIKIVIERNNLYYVADVKENKTPVYFQLTEITSSGFVCENRDHDFPKKIEYSLKGSILTVIISGDGKSQDYLFVRR